MLCGCCFGPGDQTSTAMKLAPAVDDGMSMLPSILIWIEKVRVKNGEFK